MLGPCAVFDTSNHDDRVTLPGGADYARTACPEGAALATGDAATGLAVIGCDDAWTPPDDVDALEAAGATVVRYEGADHGFVHDASRPAHRADDAADAWSRVLAWLAP